VRAIATGHTLIKITISYNSIEFWDRLLVPQPLIQIPVAIKSERGMLKMDVAKHKNGATYVFLYYTESGGKRIGDDTTNGVQPTANVLYRYELSNDHLIYPKLLLTLPAIPIPNHDGGKVVVGPDNNVYVIIDDLHSHRTQLQNVIDGPPADDTIPNSIIKQTIIFDPIFLINAYS
jgi:aldose sugar dehydrogenase